LGSASTQPVNWTWRMSAINRLGPDALHTAIYISDERFHGDHIREGLNCQRAITAGLVREV